MDLNCRTLGWACRHRAGVLRLSEVSRREACSPAAAGAGCARRSRGVIQRQPTAGLEAETVAPG